MTVMRTRLIVALSFLLAANTGLHAQGTAFTYQGRLNDGGKPSTGIYDLRFTIFDSTNQPGNVIAGPLTNSATAVSNGLFAVTLDFGAGVFTGNPYFLEMGVRTNGNTNAFTVLSPRQLLTPTPYAIFANTASNLSGPLPAAQVAGTLPASAFAAYSNTVAQIATAAAQAVMTNNLILSGLAASPENLYTRQLPHFYSRLRSHLPVRILWLGDSVGGDTAFSLCNSLGRFMPTNGCALSDPGLATNGSPYFFNYETPNGGFGDAIFPSMQHQMSDGQTLQSANGFGLAGYNVNTVEVYYWASNNFGTLTVQTNFNNGAFATLATINANNGGARKGVFTNFFFPLQSNLNVRLVSSGNNIVLGIGLWNTNANAGFHMISFCTGGLDLGDWFASGTPSANGYTYTSNDFVTFFQGASPDLVILEALDDNSVADGHITNNLAEALNCIRNSTASNCDVVWVNPQPANPANGIADAQRSYALYFSIPNFLPIFDEYSLINTNGSMSYLYLDSTHLNAQGKVFIGDAFVNWLGLPQCLINFGY